MISFSWQRFECLGVRESGWHWKVVLVRHAVNGSDFRQVSSHSKLNTRWFERV